MGVLFVRFVEKHPTASNKIRVTFSENVISGDVVAGNFALDNGATISAVAVVTSTTVYDLTCAGLISGTLFTLTVSNIRDSASSTAIVAAVGGTFKFYWTGQGDNNLDGVPEVGGILTQPVTSYIGDRPLGNNTAITTYLQVVGAFYVRAAAVLRVTCGEDINTISATTNPASYTITPPVGSPAINVTSVSVGGNYVDLTLDGIPTAGVYQIEVAGSTFVGAVTGEYNLNTVLLWSADSQRRRGNFNTGFQ